MTPTRFKKHYTLTEARALLPLVREWLGQMDQAREELEATDRRLDGLAGGGRDTGGELVNQSVRLLALLQQVLRRFENREIFIKDLSRGLVDFPSLKDGREIFLCWERDEEDIQFWHEIDAGYAGREKI
jgi:hypothetical protein